MRHAACVVVRDPFHPWRGAQAQPVRRRTRLRALAPRIDEPFICLLNGQAQLRATWNRRVKRGDLVAFVVLPQGGGDGGGGSDPMRVVLTLAVMAYAGPLAGMINTGLGLGLAAGGIGMGLLTAAIGMVGSALVNTLLPPPSAPSPQMAQALAAPSPTYNLGAQGNAARLGAPIPDHYGRHIAYMDFGAEPYAEYAGNEQFLYQLFVLGQGHYDIETIRVEDTPVGSFEDVTTEIVGPGGTVTLFPTDVANSPEVAGQELTTGVAVGPFAVNASGTLANYLGVDLVCPRGIYYANDSGGLDARSVTIKIEARPIDGAGAATGAWATLGTETISGATSTPQRRSYRYVVTAGRYQVQCTRLDAKDTSSRAGHEVVWAGLRAYLPGTQQYGDITVIALRARATNNLSAQSSRRINCIATRKLPTWHPTTGWSAPTATRSIAWAFANVCRASYGADLPDSRVPLAELYALDAIWSGREDYFDARFDNAMTVWEALEHIARAGRAKRWMQGGVVRIARDQPATLPVAAFSPLNMTRGSFGVQYLMPTEETADAVEVEYFDSASWKPLPVTAALPGSVAAKPAKLKLFGVTGRAHAWREGMHMAACNKWRRKIIGHGTELEGHIPGPLDLVAETHDMPQWGQWAEAIAWNATSKTLTVTEPFTWAAGTHYVQLRRRDGSAAGPYPVVAGATSYDLVLTDWNAAADPTPDVGDERERTHVAFGTATTLRQLCRLVSAKPQGNGVVLELVNEDDRVHTADQTAMPAATANWALPLTPTGPVVEASSLQVVQDGTPARPVLAVSWRPAAGADHYTVEQSADGVVWTRVGGDVSTANTSFSVQPGPVYVRVAGVGLTRGPWASTGQIAAGTNVAPPPDVTGLALAESFTGPMARFAWNETPRSSYYRAEIWAGTPLVLKRTRTVTVPRYEYSAEDATADGGPWRSFTLKVYAVGGGGATSANAASLEVTNPQVAQLNNVSVTGLLASLLVDLDRPADTDLAGFRIWVDATSGFTPAAGNLVYEGPENTVSIDLNPGSATYYVRVAGYDRWGTDALNISGEFTAATTLIVATQIADNAISTPKLAANAVTADKVAARTLTANEIAVGTLTGTEISASAKIVAGSGNDVAVLDGADATYRIYAGHATPASAPFWVKKSGELYTTSGKTAGSFEVGGVFTNSSLIRQAFLQDRASIPGTGTWSIPGTYDTTLSGFFASGSHYAMLVLQCQIWAVNGTATLTSELFCNGVKIASYTAADGLAWADVVVTGTGTGDQSNGIITAGSADVVQKLSGSGNSSGNSLAGSRWRLVAVRVSGNTFVSSGWGQAIWSA